MSSPAEQVPSTPDDAGGDSAGTPRDSGAGVAAAGARAGAHAGGDSAGTPREHAGRRRLSLQDQARVTLAKKVAKAVRAHRAIAKATAKRARVLADLEQWASDPGTAKLLNPDYAIDPAVGVVAVLTDSKASRRKVAAWEDQEIARRTVTSEIACALHLAERTAANLIGEAAMFAGPMHATLDALNTGMISYRHAQVLMEQLSFIPLEELHELEATLLPVARELTVGKLAVKARRIRQSAHPETIAPRATAAIAERGVWWEGRDDGMGTLTWYGTAEQTQAAHDRLSQIAGSTHAHELDDASLPEELRRTIGQICADAAADLLLGGVTPTGTGTHTGSHTGTGTGTHDGGLIRGNVMITVPVFTLMGLSDEPGILEGYGPIPADRAREIAAGCPSFIRLLTHPETGAVLSVGKDHYTPPADLRRWVALRDGTCRFPGCTRPATRSEIDHTTAWEHDGPTDYDNLAHLCTPHHRLKHQTLWTVVQEPGGILAWTSPAGRTHRTHPETHLGPPTPPPPGAPPPQAQPQETPEPATADGTPSPAAPPDRSSQEGENPPF